MEEQDQGTLGGGLNGTTEELEKAQHQQEGETEAGENQDPSEQQQSEGVTGDPKVESEDEGTGQDLPESHENSGDDEPVIKEQVAEELIEVHEIECVIEAKEGEESNYIEGEEEVQESSEEKSPDEPVNEETEEPLKDQETYHNKESHVNGTSGQKENKHIEAGEQLIEEEENLKNKDQETSDTVDFKKKEIINKENHHSISELKSKWDSFGKEQNCPPLDHHTHHIMSDAKTSRFGGTVEKCNQCQKTVYAMERLEVAGRLMHKTCFRCSKCNSPLSVGRFSVGGGELYCMTHYKQAFREKGTYDVFTPDNPIKGKWQNKPAE